MKRKKNFTFSVFNDGRKERIYLPDGCAGYTFPKWMSPKMNISNLQKRKSKN
jgi:hypothetical protein